MAETAESRPVAIQVSDVKKMYKLGQIGGGTLQADLQSWWAKKRGKEDPNSRINEGERSYGDTFMALNGVDLTIYQGEAVGIIGSNGAGKSTLLKLLSRVTAPTEGDIDIYGRIASMLEVGTGFNGELTGRENVYMNGAILGMTKQEIDSKMEQIIEFSEVREFIDTPVKRYSSGMFVKLAFSVAAHLDAEIMIMDEVLAVGDMAFQKKCLAKMREAAKEEGRTVLYVSHNMNTIRTLCDRCIVLNQGKIVFSGDVESAIEVYLQEESTESPFINYSEYPSMNRMENPKVKITYTEFIDKDTIKFKNEEQLKIRINWINMEDIIDLCLRIEILDYDRKPIGSSIDYNIYSGKNKEKATIDVSLLLPNLVSGKYTMNYTFFYMLDNGTHMNIECVHGLYFEIINPDEVINWQKKYFGSIQLPKFKIIRCDYDKKD